MTAAEKIAESGFDDVIILDNYSYDDALMASPRAAAPCMITTKWWNGLSNIPGGR